MSKTRKDIIHLNAGEWSNKVSHRVDHQKHASALKRGLNVVSTVHGAVTKRKGFEMIAPAKYDNRASRLIRFRFSKEDTVCIEVGHQYMRFHQNGQQIREQTAEVNTITKANPVQLETVAAHGLATGDEIYISGLNLTWALNNRWVKVTVTGATTMTLQDRDGNDIDGTESWWPLGEIAGGSGTIEKVYEISTVFEEDNLANLDFAQKDDVIWLVDGKNPVQKLTRLGVGNWTIEEESYDIPPTLDPNTEGNDTLSCDVTTGSGTLTATGHTPFVQDEHVGSYWVLRHLRPAADVEILSGAPSGNVSANAIKVYENVTFETSGNWTNTVTVLKSIVESPNLTTYDSAEWTVIGVYDSDKGSGGNEGRNYNVRFSQNGIPRYYLAWYVTPSGALNWHDGELRADSAIVEGVVQVTAWNSTSSVDVNVIKELDSTGKTDNWSEGAWSDYRGYPNCVCLFEKAIWFANTTNNPQGIWKSETGIYDSFKLGDEDTNGLFIELDSKERNDILWLVPQDKLMIGTSGSEWTISGTDLNSIVSPTNIVARRQENRGSQNIRPEVIDDVIMHVKRGSSQTINGIAYSLERDRFHGKHLQQFSDHLTQSGIVSMAYQAVPDSVLWVVNGGGELLSFTFDVDQEVMSWNPHSTDGEFEDVETIYGTEDDEVWVVVKRSVGNTTRRFIERMTGYYNPPIAQTYRSNGLVGTGSKVKAQIALLIDISGSMTNDLEAVKRQAEAVTAEFARRYEMVEFALYSFGSEEIDPVQETDFTTASAFLAALDALEVDPFGSIENGYATITAAANDMTWLDDADKYMVLFTDEDSDDSANLATTAAALDAKSISFTYSDSSIPAVYNDYNDLVNTIENPLDPITSFEQFVTATTLASSGRSSEKVFLDSCIKFEGKSYIEGLWHLEGREVTALADGRVVDGLTVTYGQVFLGFSAFNVYVGLPYTAIVQPLQINGDATSGVSIGYTKNVSRVYAYLNNTIGMKYSDGHLLRDVSFRTGSQAQSLPPELFNGEVEIPLRTGHSRDPQIIMSSPDPLPFTLAALIVHYDITSL